jgi:hypothetical protein
MKMVGEQDKIFPSSARGKTDQARRRFSHWQDAQVEVAELYVRTGN